MRPPRTAVGFEVDQLPLDSGVLQRFQRLLRQLLRKFDKRVLGPDGDVAEVAAVQSALVGDCADDVARPHLVALADKALGRGGRMNRAIAEIGRGEECSEGEPFTLELS